MGDESRASDRDERAEPSRPLATGPGPGPDVALGVEEVRRKWARMVADAAAGARIVVHAPHGVRAVLAPPTPDVIAAQGELPVFTMTAARQGLGNLVRAAAEGTPQLLLRYRTVYAQITHLSAAPTPANAPPAAVRPAPPTTTRPDPDTTAPDPPATPKTGRRVAGFATALGEATTARRRAVSFGPAALDEALGGGALPGRLVLVVGAPGAGAGLLAAGTVLSATLAPADDPDTPHTVLSCTPGRPRADIAARLTAAAAGVDHRRLRAGTLAETERHAADAASARLAAGGLLLDDGADLTLDLLRETAADIAGLRLIAVDPLNHLLGSAGPAVSDVRHGVAALRRLAADLDVPVVAVWETGAGEPPEVAAALADADSVVHLTREGEQAFAIVAERDLGPVAQAALHADLAHVRFTDPPPASTVGAEAGPADNAEPPAPASREQARGRQDRPPAGTPATAPRPSTTPARTGARPASAAPKAPAASKARRVVPDTDEDPLPGTIAAAVAQELAAAQGDITAAGEALARRAIPDVMELLRLSRAGSRYEHTWYPPLPDLLRKRSKEESDAIWEARPKWRNKNLPPGDHDVTALDMNAAYLSALKAHLPIGPLEHRAGPDLDDFEGPRGRRRRRAGIYLVDPPAWDHEDLPNPLGDRDEPGPLWITDPTLRLLLRCASPAYGSLCEEPRVLESWTAVATENLLERLRAALRDARDTAIADGDDVTLDYVKQMYAKLVSTMGGSNYNREINRPDWMHIIRSQAFSNLWVKAFKAHQGGLAVVRVMGTDELHLTGGDWRTVFTEGRGVGDVKIKDTYTLQTKERN
ncbi:DnaB-like helicase C-terminal domain-containing protein [Embleya hyalina]|uniref:Replicative DNA helicase n=1 Tax=Embleya hyalina TaxID=516124 RepID=A0A401Z2E7_9ACTN|nr:DnaB-like helicase C-terminal domain-containing protein [Embleya hyalina]GCE01022.1 replicative DNA helicase [Embleya hyalina]